MAQNIPPPPDPIDVLVMACDDNGCNFRPVKAQRRACGDEDVLIDMKYCGICHSDCVVAANRFKSMQPTVYPCVPGHELVGIVSQVGCKVTKFSVGDQIGVGCMVDACLSCTECRAGKEHQCKKDITMTYQGKDKHKRASFAGCNLGDAPVQRTMGGYTTKMVVHERFAVKIPESFPLEAAGPVMCAAITVYEPMKDHGVQSGMKLAVVGLGGLGMTAIKIGTALGADVSAVSRGTKKEPLAKDAGAKGFVNSSSDISMRSAANSFDLIIDTIPMSHDPKDYHGLLKPRGIYVFLGLTEQFLGTVIASQFCCGSGDFRVSFIGSIKNTQEVMDLCDKHKILPHTKIISISDINSAITELESGNDTGVRFVLDIGTLTEAALDTWKELEPPTLSDKEKPPTLGNACRFCCKISCCGCLGGRGPPPRNKSSRTSSLGKHTRIVETE